MSTFKWMGGARTSKIKKSKARAENDAQRSFFAQPRRPQLTPVNLVRFDVRNFREPRGCKNACYFYLSLTETCLLIIHRRFLASADRLLTQNLP